MTNLTIIQDRWNRARKLYGATDEIITASGVKVRGRYVLCESGAVTPSHDPFNAYRKSEGFPTDENGQSVNDRDYERDTDAQTITKRIADNYDSRALQSQVVVSDGIVLSGNGRTMAGMIAAANMTDAAYNEYVSAYAGKWGFAQSDVCTFRHPRVIFETADKFTLNAETFAMFNAQEIKSQSKTEQAVKLGKLVSDDMFARILRNINTFDTIGDFYANTKAATETINELVSAGVVSRMQYPEMFDGDTISAQAKELLENVLIGKAFSRSADSVRKITSFKGVRRNVVVALTEISTNIALGDYSLESELSQAINLCYQARSNGDIGHGEQVSAFARQRTMFDESDTVADFRNAIVMLLADTLNHSKVTRLKKLYSLYNYHAVDAASGQMDMFAGAVRTKEEILTDVKRLFDAENAARLDSELTNANFQRRIDAVTAIHEEGRVADAKPQTQLQVGKTYGVLTEKGEVVTAKLERIDGNDACVRLQGFKRMRVPLSSVIAA